MKLVRYQDSTGRISFGRSHDDGRITRIDGDVPGSYQDSGVAVTSAKWLAPIEPRDIICIGLNYRQHAAEGNQSIPKYPIVFMKNSGTLQNPGDPIILPRRLRSDAVDYECELAVVMGRECSRLADRKRRQPMVSRQNIRHLLPAGTVDRHAGRDRRSECPVHQDRAQW